MFSNATTGRLRKFKLVMVARITKIIRFLTHNNIQLERKLLCLHTEVTMRLRWGFLPYVSAKDYNELWEVPKGTGTFCRTNEMSKIID